MSGLLQDSLCAPGDSGFGTVYNDGSSRIRLKAREFNERNVHGAWNVELVEAVRRPNVDELEGLALA
jgi:hypothetical protein